MGSSLSSKTKFYEVNKMDVFCPWLCDPFTLSSDNMNVEVWLPLLPGGPLCIRAWFGSPQPGSAVAEVITIVCVQWDHPSFSLLEMRGSERIHKIELQPAPGWCGFSWSASKTAPFIALRKATMNLRSECHVCLDQPTILYHTMVSDHTEKTYSRGGVEFQCQSRFQVSVCGACAEADMRFHHNMRVVANLHGALTDVFIDPVLDIIKLYVMERCVLPRLPKINICNPVTVRLASNRVSGW